MSLDIDLTVTVETGATAPHAVTLFSRNITHNLNVMARKAGIYQHVWRPEELGISEAAYLIPPLTAGLALLKADPDNFRRFDARWGRCCVVSQEEGRLGPIACDEVQEALTRVS